ncbi:hypothetical protein BDZ97DRAFT_1767055 [Flammula alnicola]|nr:hypothetical protein BDZ97DRAFT_1767055 [Flammula alnicola]
MNDCNFMWTFRDMLKDDHILEHFRDVYSTDHPVMQPIILLTRVHKWDPKLSRSYYYHVREKPEDEAVKKALIHRYGLQDGDLTWWPEVPLREYLLPTVAPSLLFFLLCQRFDTVPSTCVIRFKVNSSECAVSCNINAFWMSADVRVSVLTGKYSRASYRWKPTSPLHSACDRKAKQAVKLSESKRHPNLVFLVSTPWLDQHELDRRRSAELLRAGLGMEEAIRSDKKAVEGGQGERMLLHGTRLFRSLTRITSPSFRRAIIALVLVQI